MVHTVLRAAVVSIAFVTFATSGVASADRGKRGKNASAKPTVAFLYFDYEGSDEELGLLRKGLAQMLAAELTAVDSVTIIERQRLEEVLAELELQKKKQIDRKSAVAAGKLLGAHYLVVGRYLVFRGKMQVTARVLEVETGSVLFGTNKRGSPDGFFELQEALSDELGDYFSVDLATHDEGKRRARRQSRAKRRRARRAKRKQQPKLAAATVAQYGGALDDLDQGRVAEGRARLEKLVKENPDLHAAASDLKDLVR